LTHVQQDITAANVHGGQNLAILLLQAKVLYTLLN
jgi:hypothetical protein